MSKIVNQVIQLIDKLSVGAVWQVSSWCTEVLFRRLLNHLNLWVVENQNELVFSSDLEQAARNYACLHRMIHPSNTMIQDEIFLLAL